MRHRSAIIPLLLLCALPLLGWLAYAPGLHGGFLFDDFGNLPALGASGPVDNWPTFWRYITSGNADPTGRPLTLLTFLIDAHDWPANPHPFKRTGLLLHLSNGLLLAMLLNRLGRLVCRTTSKEPIAIAAVLGAALWCLHPLLVSTTLYIVQREAMLPATFTLLGLLAWLLGRRKMLEGASISGLAWIMAGLGGCTVLAFLSKANGILLPTFALLLECVLLQPRKRVAANRRTARSYKHVMIVFGWLPTLVVATYLLHAGWQGIAGGISDTRPWTLGQRLITEPRVLVTYLDLLWLPTPFTAGLFNDQIKASASLLHPWTTLPAIVIVLGMIIGAWRVRHRWPALAAAVLFFFVGQSIESSTIALELFFEHRNYLPSLLMFWPLALWLFDIPLSASSHHRYDALAAKPATTSPGVSTPSHRLWRLSKRLLALAICIGLLLMTWARASLWGNTHDQALLWARLNPASARAQAFAAQTEIEAGRPELAMRRLQPALDDSPNEVQLALNLVAAQCAAGRLDQATLLLAERALATARDSGSLLSSWFERRIEQAGMHACPLLDLNEIERLLAAAQRNPWLIGNHGRQQDIDYLLGRIAIRRNAPERALTLFNAGLAEQPRESLALSQAAALGSAGFPAQGLAHLTFFESLPKPPDANRWNMARLHAYVLERQHFWPREMARLRATLQQDLHDSRAPAG